MSRHDDVLTDYVRERLDRLAAASPEAKAATEAAQTTVLRPRPTFGHPAASFEPARGLSDSLPDWWHDFEHERGPRRAADPHADEPEVAGSRPTKPARGAAVLGIFRRQHVMVVGIVLILGVLIATFAMTRARAIPLEAPVPVAAVTPGGPAPSISAASVEASPAAEPLQVHVVGEVTRPGVHRVPVGARVADAIEAAGGLTESARPGELNLAQVLADGQQVIIGGGQRPSEVRGGASAGDTAPAAAGSSAAKLNLNAASAAQLDALPGVGPVTAEKILAWRTEHKKFTRIEELQEVPGIGPKSFAEIAPHVTV